MNINKRVLHLFLLCIIAISITGCSFKNSISKAIIEEPDKFARDYIGLIRSGNLEEAAELVDPEFVNAKTPEDLRKIQLYLDKGKLISTEIVEYKYTKFGVVVDRENGYSITNLLYQLEFEKAWMVANVVVKFQDSKMTVYKLHVNEIPSPLSELNAFSLKGISPDHYLMLVLIVLVPGLIIASFVICLRSDIRMKWLWAIFILLGFGNMSINWTTGLFGYGMSSINLLGAGVLRSGPYGPWILTVSIPVGAIVFLSMRKKLLKNSTVEKNGSGKGQESLH